MKKTIKSVLNFNSDVNAVYTSEEVAEMLNLKEETVNALIMEMINQNEFDEDCIRHASVCNTFLVNKLVFERIEELSTYVKVIF